MFSVVIPSPTSVRQLEPLLAALVPAAVDGLVREVIVADPAEGLAEFLEDAGAETVVGGVAAAARAAKSDRLLVLPPDLRLPADWRRRLARGQTLRGGWFGPVGRIMSRRGAAA